MPFVRLVDAVEGADAAEPAREGDLRDGVARVVQELVRFLEAEVVDKGLKVHACDGPKDAGQVERADVQLRRQVVQIDVVFVVLL